MDGLLADLTAIVGSEHVLTDPDMTAGYTTDWTRRYRGTARCVVRPASVREVAEAVRACAGRGVAIVPQGGNTGLVAGGVPCPGAASSQGTPRSGTAAPGPRCSAWKQCLPTAAWCHGSGASWPTTAATTWPS